MPLTSARLAHAALAVAALLTLPAVASGASVTIVAPSPAAGAQIQTTADGARVTLAWTADSADCAEPATIAHPVLAGPIMASVGTISGVSPSGANVLRLLQPVSRPTTIAWYVTMRCDEAEIRSERRAFTLIPPDRHPRLAGAFRMSGLGAERSWSFRPGCARGACDTGVRVQGLGAFRLRYRPASTRYVAAVDGPVAARFATCRDASGDPVAGAYTGTFRLSLAAGLTTIRGAGTWAERLRGSFSADYVPTAAGVAAGCRAFSPRRAVRGQVLAPA